MSEQFRCCLLLVSAVWAQKEPFDVQALLRVARIGDPQLSPDGRSVAFTFRGSSSTTTRGPTHIYTVPLAGGQPRQLTKEGTRNDRPRWSPDSRQLAFISDRGGTSQGLAE